MIRFEIECGDFSGVFNAATPQAAWKAATDGRPGELSKLARFRELPWNQKYSWDAREGRGRRGRWLFVEPSWFETPAAAALASVAALSSTDRTEP